MFVMLLLLASCQELEVFEYPVAESASGEVEVSFSVLLPDDKEATKAFGVDPYEDIKDLYLIVFDENGYFIEYRKAELADSEASHQVGSSSTHLNERAFTVTLMKTEKERIIHFIANCPVGQIHYGHESDMIASLYTTRGSNIETSYWGRAEVWYIKTGEDDKLLPEIAEIFKCVPLLRNYASVTVNNKATSSFVMESYAIYNTINIGTVAPYNTVAHGFQSFVNGSDGSLLSYDQLLEADFEGHALSAAVLKTTLSESDFLPPGTPTYMYERKVSVRPGAEHQWSESPPHIIIKGRYNNAAAYSYYKVDMLRFDENNNKSYYYNILRNFKYTFNIKTVAGPGYPTLQEAMDNPAGNNLAGATDTQGYTNVSDGLGRIFVSYTDTTLTSNNAVKLRYKYVPSIQNYDVTANDRVKVEGILDGTGSVIKGKVDGHTDLIGEMAGWREVTFNVQNPGAITHLQEIYLNVTDNANLNKTIRYRLQKSLNMVVNCWPENIAKQAGKLMDVAIRLPDDLTEDMFPLDLAIEVEKYTLSPDASQPDNVMPVEPSMSIVPDKAEKRSYHFVKTIETFDDYLALEMYGDLKLVRTYWLTTKAQNASKVYVYNKYFDLAGSEFFNVEAFTLLEFPNGVKEGVGSPTVFEFNMNTVTPVTVTLVGLVNEKGESSFIYQPEKTGRQTLNLKTSQQSGIVSVTLNAEKYEKGYLEAVQSSEINLEKLVITFRHTGNTSNSPQANSVTPTLSVSGGGSISYGSIKRERSGNSRNYTYKITYSDVVITDAGPQATVDASYTYRTYSYKGSASVQSLAGSADPTITLTQ